MAKPLLQTKFYVPNAHTGIVSRPHLIERLNEALDGRRSLTLVSAPAGYGKTTLVADWLRQLCQASDAVRNPSQSFRHSWLSLDDADSDPTRFVTYLLASIREAGLLLEKTENALLKGSQSSSDNEVITNLLNEFTQFEDSSALVAVLDDYHRIQNPKIHAALQYWIDHAPPNLHLVLITREDPPFTLSRWRVGGRMIEIRVDDLRFSQDEASDFLRRSMNLSLTAHDIAALEQRTEGWVAGIQLAGLALQSPAGAQSGTDGRGFVADFIASFNGSHRYVIDYLVEEVLCRQQEQVRTFLRQTAILARLTASLCNAVTQRNDSQTILAYLEEHNLFLVPLDNGRQWFRYHHLLADSLQTTLEDDELRLLHQRATIWHEANEYSTSAVRHAMATGDLTFAADTIERCIQQASAWSSGELWRLTGWLNALPPNLLRERPILCLHASRAFYLAGDLTQSDQLLQKVEASLSEQTANEPDADGPQALATLYRAAISALRGEKLDQAIAAAGNLLEGEVDLTQHTAARAADTLGLAYALKGDPAEAERAYSLAAKLAQVAGVRYLALNAQCEMALMQISQGRLAQAAQTCRTALDEMGHEEIAPMGLVWAILGEIARRQNRLAVAGENLSKGIKLAQEGGITDDLRYAYVFLSRLKQAEGDSGAALNAWRQADLILTGFGVQRLAWHSAAERARLDLAQGNLAAAQRWAEQTLIRRQTLLVEYVQDDEDLTLGRILLETGDVDTAHEIATAVLAGSRPSGRVQATIEALVLQAMSLQAQRQAKPALAALSEAMALAAPESCIRPFVDGGQALAAMLPSMRQQMPDFTDVLIAAFGIDAETGVGNTETPGLGPTQSLVAGRVDSSTGPDLIEPLSERELEVLQLLVAGHSNSDIAAELVITVGTAKWHLHNIYQKLDVASRAQAIARAHALDLVGR